MKLLFTKIIISYLLFQTTVSKTNYLLTDGFVASEYDVVSYFSQNPKLGNNAFIAEYEHVKFKFSSLENQKIFKSNPLKYIPKYGGWCAYAIGLNGSKVTFDPKNYLIYNNELFFFFTKKTETIRYRVG